VRDQPPAGGGACHRVVHRDGRVVGYLGGADAKQALLALEATA
jgi:O6-methylguanine-DNA--protein-cysteine methyltransferase